MKQYYCESCIFNNHETVGCAAQQLRWAWQTMIMEIPLAKKFFNVRDFNYCEHFEPVDLGEE